MLLRLHFSVYCLTDCWLVVGSSNSLETGYIFLSRNHSAQSTGSGSTGRRGLDCRSKSRSKDISQNGLNLARCPCDQLKQNRFLFRKIFNPSCFQADHGINQSTMLNVILWHGNQNYYAIVSCLMIVFCAIINLETPMYPFSLQ